MKLPGKECRVCIEEKVYPKLSKDNAISKDKYLSSIRYVFKLVLHFLINEKDIWITLHFEILFSDLRRAIEMTKRINESKVYCN